MNVKFILFLALLSRANATGLSSLRGEAAEEDSLGQLACTIKGGTSQNSCDSTKSEDGSQCVWCALATYGVCVSEAIASQMEQTIPGIDCDDNGGSDDDAPDDDAADDDTAPQDDDVPDDYWNCLENYTTSKACTTAGCAWCDNKGGYGVCMDKDQAASFDDSSWYSCTMPTLYGSELPWKDPSDSSCVVATIGGNESTCKATVDSEGKACDWCSFQGYDFCLNGEQAQLAEGYGASCNGRDNDEATIAKDLINDLADPNDTTCLLATLSGDEDACKGTSDADGKPCDWCSFQGYDFCLNDDQAQLAEQYGASCDDRADLIIDIADPSDTTCLLATVSGDADTCKGTSDADGKPCDWCSFQGYEFCLNDDQAQLADQFGASCDDRADLIKDLADPGDNTCILATISGDADTCKGTSDADGKPCDWCSFQGYEFCLNDDQAQIAEQYGASCDEADAVEVSTETFSDPSDPSCLFITINGDESACRGSTDVDGKACEWCSFESYEFCLNADQAEVVGQYGATCNEETAIYHPKKDLSDPMDTQCLTATVNGDDYCQGATDSDGKPCDWCSFQTFEFCLNVDQAQLVEQFGADCGDGRYSKANDISASIA